MGLVLGTKRKVNAWPGQDLPTELSPLCEEMSQKYEGSCNQLTEWWELGFPKEGSLSSRQLSQLKDKLEKKEKKSAEQHKSLSKRNKKRHKMFQADWKAFSMWKDESHVRESRMIRRHYIDGDKKPKQIESGHIVYRPKDCSDTKPLYPVLSEFHKVDPDLDSAPPLPPPPYQGQASQQQRMREESQASAPPPENEAATHKAPEAPFPEAGSGSVKGHYMHTRSKGQNLPSTLEEEEKDDVHVPTFPMIEVAGVHGPQLVFRPWTDTDMKEAMEKVTHPRRNANKWGEDLQNMVQDYKPTFQELERLLKRQLGCEYHKIRHLFTNTNLKLRLTQQDWEHEDNAQYRDAITQLVQGVQAKFPLKQDMSVISAMQQQPDESVGAFLARLTEAYDIHSGHVPPEDGLGGNPTSAYEVHLKDAFLNRMKPEITETVKQSCLTWKICSLKDILQHAEHAEETKRRNGEQEKQRRQHKLDSAQYTMFSAITSQASHGRRQGRGHGRGRRQCHYDPEVCFQCGEKGHWARDCSVNKQKAD